MSVGSERGSVDSCSLSSRSGAHVPPNVTLPRPRGRVTCLNICLKYLDNICEHARFTQRSVTVHITVLLGPEPAQKPGRDNVMSSRARVDPGLGTGWIAIETDMRRS